MNLISYDKVNEAIDNRSNYIDVEKQCLYTRKIAYRKYICFGKRFEPKYCSTSIFIIVLDDRPEDRASSKLSFDSSGKIKIYLKNIWNYICEDINSKIKYINVNIIHTEHSDDGDIYKLEIESD